MSESVLYYGQTGPSRSVFFSRRKWRHASPLKKWEVQMEPLLLKPTEAAEVLGVGRSKIYALLAAGELPAVRVGHSVRVPLADLRRWVEERAAVRETSSSARPILGDSV
jgi:excisionase family DNA binding protein